MLFEALHISGVFLIRPEKREDSRGFLARMFCQEEFAAHGLATQFVQANHSSSTQQWTLRGMHYQLPPHAEAKLVRCTQGAIFDVAVDLRPDSPTFGGWVGCELRAEDHTQMYIPEGCAHGFLSLTPHAEVSYLVSAFYAPDAERGVRWNDPFFAIQWPAIPSIVSPKDAVIPDFQPNA